MSIWEWLFEHKNPGPVGEIKNFRDNGDKRSFLFTVISGSIALVAFGFVSWYFVIADSYRYQLFDYLMRPLVLVGYLILCATITVTPNYHNMGFLGVINNPFRYTDNMNRWLFFLVLFLLPGKLIIIPMIRLYKLVYEYKNER